MAKFKINRYGCSKPEFRAMVLAYVSGATTAINWSGASAEVMTARLVELRSMLVKCLPEDTTEEYRHAMGNIQRVLEAIYAKTVVQGPPSFDAGMSDIVKRDDSGAIA